MDGIVIILALILNPLAERRRRRLRDVEVQSQAVSVEGEITTRHEPVNTASTIETREASRSSREKLEDRSTEKRMIQK